MFELVIKGFKTEEDILQFTAWFANIGEQIYNETADYQYDNHLIVDAGKTFPIKFENNVAEMHIDTYDWDTKEKL